jgi:oxygen-independent coproporphyrinogen-3 oxidase
MARADIEAAAASGVPHVSAYQLTIEPNTAFWSRPPQLPPHDECADMQVMIEELLGGKDYGHYETAAFAKHGRRCQHNLNYWEFGDYLGIGAGAHGKVSFPDRVTRHEQAKQPAEYLKGVSRKEGTVPVRELPFEFMLNALRLVEGFESVLFPERTGLPLSAIGAQLEQAEERGLIERDPRRVRPTARGQRFLNDLLALFLSDGTPSRAPDGQGGGRVIRISSPAGR